MKIKVKVWHPTMQEKVDEIEVPDELIALSAHCDIMITSRRRSLATLRDALASAIKQEDFELAVVLRDEIRAKQKEGFEQQWEEAPVVWLDARGGRFRQR